MRVILRAEGNLKIVLDIVFRKTNRHERRRVNGKELIDTTCMILRDGREIACATARQNPLDDYNKIVGKKIALTKAIAQVEFLKHLPEYYNLTTNHCRKIMRSHIWDAFHQTFGRWN